MPYELLDGRMRSQGRARHWLSVRDLNLSDRLEEMIDAGVGSFKIEGRLKDMAYVRNVVGWYRSRLDEIFFRRPDLKRASQGSVALDFEPDPAKSFSRGSTHYFLDGPAAGVASLDTPKSLGEAVGTVVSAGREWFGMSGKIALAPGDGICFADETGELRGTYVNRTEDGRVYPNRLDGIGCGTAETAVICQEGMCRNAGGQSCDDYVFYVPTTTGPCMYAVRFGRTLSKRSLDRSIRSRGNRNRHRYYGVYN